MVKYKLYFDKDQETQWLNELSKEGWAMTSFFAGLYTFEKCEPGKYIYQVDFGGSFGHVSGDYREFMAESNIEIVQCWGPWVILRKLASEGDFVLYTDVDSQIEQYKKILFMFKLVTIFELLILAVEILGIVNGSKLAWALTFLIAAIVVTMFRAVIRTKNIIHELNERKTGIAQTKNNNVSPILPAALLVNSCALMMGDSVSYPLHLTVQILAIVLMLVGIVATCAKRKENNE